MGGTNSTRCKICREPVESPSDRIALAMPISSLSPESLDTGNKGFCFSCSTAWANRWVEHAKMSGIASHISQETPDMEISEEPGICDGCGEHADELVLSNGEWVCRACTNYSLE